MSATPSVELQELARAYGVQLEYVGMSGQVEPAPTESLMAVLRVLGASLDSEKDVPAALAERRMEHWRRRIEPVVVAWEGVVPTIEVRLPEALASTAFRCHLEIEGGGIAEWTGTVPDSKGGEVPNGFVVGIIEVPGPLPTGYHPLAVEFEDGEIAQTLLVSAPLRAYQAPESQDQRLWGIFSPLYALHRETSWGAGDFSDLEALIDWTASLGGSLVATLPMLASNFDGPDPIISPYSPTSRIFWNEFYLDLNRIPDLARSEAARTLLAAEESEAEIAALRSSGLVHYGRQMKLKRSVLELLADEVETLDGERFAALQSYAAEHPEACAYAFFQAAGERHGRNWRAWNATLNPTNPDADIDPRSYRYHLYSQWQADEQLKGLSLKAREKGLIWYLDFPIGVDFNSFDVWTHQGAFATGASVGCPPDPVFTKGQNWGFPPIHPDRHRETGYAYLRASLQAHLKYANALRIDHVMGLHRLFWIPQGTEAKQGAFVSSPADEIYAILSVESHRHQAWLVGEDLGTVPPEVDGAMRRHNVRGMYVVQYEVRPDPVQPLREPPASTIASVNTHDMPPFAAFWGSLDLDDRKDLGLLTGEGLEQERSVRADQHAALVGYLRQAGLLPGKVEDAEAVLSGLWQWLADSDSGILLLNIEDLWLETESQNTPNTYTERPNWRRKLRRSFEQFAEDPKFVEILKRIDEIRSN